LLHLSSGTSGDAHLIIEADTDNNNELDNPKIVFRQDGGFYTGELGLDSNRMVFRSKASTVDNTGFVFYSNVFPTFHMDQNNLNDLEDTQVEVMRIDGNGNVGIGTATPKNILHTVSDNHATFSMSSSAGWSGIRLGMPYTTNHDAYCSVIEAYNNPANNYNSELRFKTSYGDNAAATERMRITSLGNVGIGTASPLNILTIKQPTAGGAYDLSDLQSNAAISIRGYGDGNDGLNIGLFDPDGNGNNSRGYIQNWWDGTGVGREFLINPGGGNVGIGTTNPYHQLHVDSILGISPPTGTSGSDSQLAMYGTFVDFPSDTGPRRVADIRAGFATDTWSNEYMSFHVGKGGAANDAKSLTIERMRIAGNGNVGIGKTNPNIPLDVGNALENPRIGRDLNFGSVHDADKRDSVFFGRRDGSGLDFLGMECKVDTHTALGYGDYSNQTKIRFYTWGNNFFGSREVMAILGSGDVGINDTTPSYKLDVGGTLRAFGITDSSDRRIKKNIVDVNDTSALETIRLLKPKKYDYKDTESRTHETVWGFIAQDVREVLPYATDVISDYIPNVMEYVNVSSSNVLTFDTSVLESNVVNLRLKDIRGHVHDVTIDEIIDGNTIRVIEDLDAWTGSFDAEGNVIIARTTTTITVEEYEALEDTTGYKSTADGYTKTTTTYPGSQIFVYGQKVDDFHTLRKNAIWTIATAALQEVDRQLQAEKAKVATLETQLASVLARLDALESA
jgi:hypothetical protein